MSIIFKKNIWYLQTLKVTQKKQRKYFLDEILKEAAEKVSQAGVCI